MKKILFVLTIFTLTYNTTKGQNTAKIDSLLKTLPKVSDSAKVDVLNGLASEYLLFDVDEKTKQAEDYVNKALELSRSLSYSKGLANGLKSSGIVLMRKKDYRVALRNLFQALALVEDLNSDVELAICFQLIGDCYRGKKDITKAIDYYAKAFQNYEKHDETKKVVAVLNDLARLYVKVKQSQPALDYAIISLQRAEAANLRKDRRDTYEILAKVYKIREEYSEAFSYQEKYAALKDSIAKEESLESIAKLEENHRAEEQARIAKERQEQRNNLQYLGISAFFILLFGGLFFVGDVAIPPHVMRRMIFIALFLTFQFLLLLLNPILQEYAGGVALLRLLMNGFFALGFVFLIRYLEKRINMRLEKRIRRRIKKRVQKKIKNVDPKDDKNAKSDTKSTNKGMQSEVAAS
ncbi:hypothetical protein BKI52_08415 [marine bacterium AO1-C]|nr:hypothetical protein BKI52_08415 [marine bacterium AO1-C]